MVCLGLLRLFALVEQQFQFADYERARIEPTEPDPTAPLALTPTSVVDVAAAPTDWKNN